MNPTRKILKSIAFFFIGIALSYAVAWACAVNYYTYTIGNQVDGMYLMTFEQCYENEGRSDKDELFVVGSSIGYSYVDDLGDSPPFRLRGLPPLDKVVSIEMTEFFDVSDSIDRVIDRGDLPSALCWHFEPPQNTGQGTRLAGWPLPCCFAVVQPTPDLKSVASVGEITYRSGNDIIYLPYLPNKFYLLLNAIFYGLLTYAINITTKRSLRALIENRRTRKGLCKKCKYDLRSNPAPQCPECGHTHLSSPKTLPG